MAPARAPGLLEIATEASADSRGSQPSNASFPALPEEEGLPQLLAAAKNVVAFSLLPAFMLAGVSTVSRPLCIGLYVVFFCYLLALLFAVAQGFQGAKFTVRTMGRRALFEAYALKRLIIPLMFLYGFWLAKVMLYDSRNLAFMSHRSLASYPLKGSRARTKVLNAAVHTHDYVTLQEPAGANGVPGRYVRTEFGHWRGATWDAAPLRAVDELPAAWTGQLQGEALLFYIYDDIDWKKDRPRPRPLEIGDRVFLMAGNHRVLTCRADGAAWASVYWWENHITDSIVNETAFVVQQVKAAGQWKAGSEVWLTRNDKALSIRDGRLGCFSDWPSASENCGASPGLIVDSMYAHSKSEPELVLNVSGRAGGHDVVRLPLGEALNRTYLAEHAPSADQDTEVELSLPFGYNGSARVEWPEGTSPLRLHDTGFELLPDLSDDKEALEMSETLQKICTGVVPALASVAAVLWPLQHGKTMQGWTPGIVVIGFRIGRITSMAYLLRVATFLSTSIPGGPVYCQPSWNGGREDINKPPPFSLGYGPLFDADNLASNCGDNIFSGHTTNDMSAFCVLSAYLWALCCPPSSSRCLRLGLKLLYFTLILLYAGVILAQLWFILACRNHYTVDVTVALYTVPLVYLLDSRLVSEDVAPPEDLDLRQLLCDLWSWVPLPLAWTEPLRRKRRAASQVLGPADA